ncbi:MAG: ABC transporter ATP-binding protein [Opitutales bacterium]|nr:ABC transporter ATP-binding protein [Opitutales bacterium]MCH8540211.1 ABC transporter ATP-binding protein [Opitutales bacterium]
MISIQVNNLTKRFGEVTALKNLDLTIEPGELFFLLGPSGCGKTTLLRSLAGFYIPEEGQILFGGRDITRLPPHKRNTGMMFQSYALWPHMTVAQNVAFGLEQRKVSKAEIRERVQEALDSVQMGSYGERKPNQLSGGQQQRVALARALVIRPQCLFLDEPLSNLDAKLRLEMRAEIRRICKEFELTAIYVTHDQKEALSVSDRLAVLDGGKILQVGTPREVYRRPTSRVVANFIGETNFIEGTVRDAAAGMVAVETPLGVFAGVGSPVDHTFQSGEKVQISVRPECWRIDQIPSDENCVAGEIAGTIYLGETAQHQFAAGESSLKIFELNPRFGAENSPKQLYATVDEEDVVVLPLS